MIEIRDATQEDLDYVRENSIDSSIKNYPKWNLNGWSKTGLIDGEIAGMGGVIVYWPGVGEGWFCFTKKVLEHKIEVMRFARRIIEEAFKELKLRRLQVSERTDFPQSVKMAESLGFVNETPNGMKGYLPDGGDAYLYAIVRK